MKRIIFIIAFLILLINIPILTEANDSLATESESPLLQKQELKLPWYKVLSYEIGYSGGLCRNYNPFHEVPNDINYFPFDFKPNLSWYNTLNLGIILPNRKWGMGIEYGFWPQLTNREGFYHIAPYYPWSSRWAVKSYGVFTRYYIIKSLYFGFSVDNYITNMEDTLSDSIIYGRWECIGGNIFLGYEDEDISLGKIVIVPFARVQIGYSKEYIKNVPQGWENTNLEISTSGVFAGIKIRTESKITNPILQKEKVKLPWYKNVDYTIGYNVGLCLRGEDLNYYPHGGVDVVGNIVGKFYWLNSMEAGVRIPIKNRIIETGLGYGWADIGSGNIETRFPDTLVNNITVNSADLEVANIRKLYIYTGHSISKSIYMGLEFNYYQAYGDEVYYPYVYPNSFVNVRRDLIGGGCYIKLSPTITLNKSFRINPYFMIKIGKANEVHSTSPYSGLWGKKLTVWYTGLYGGFNFNIGGKR